MLGFKQKRKTLQQRSQRLGCVCVREEQKPRQPVWPSVEPARLAMPTRKRPAAFAAPPKKRLRGKQEALSFNEDLPKKFLTWRSQHIYAAYKNLGG